MKKNYLTLMVMTVVLVAFQNIYSSPPPALESQNLRNAMMLCGALNFSLVQSVRLSKYETLQKFVPRFVKIMAATVHGAAAGYAAFKCSHYCLPAKKENFSDTLKAAAVYVLPYCGLSLSWMVLLS